MKKDPVCGAVFDVRGATAISRYRDRYYYFCSLRCRDTFEQVPQRFVVERAGGTRKRTCGRRKAA